MFADARALQQFCGIAAHLFLNQQETIEGTYAAQDSGNAAGLDAEVKERSGKLVELLQRDMTEVDAHVGIIVQQLLQVPFVCIQRVLRV